MTPNEIIKAMDEFAALQAKATDGPWSFAPYTKKKFGVGRSGGSAFFMIQCVHDDTASESAIIDAATMTRSRTIPAAEAAALIREMRGMLRKYNEKTQNDPVALCLICERLTCDTDCKLAQMLKD